MSSSRGISRFRIALALAGALVVVGLFVWFQQHGGQGRGAATPENPFVGLNLEDPEACYLVLRHAAETGGNENTRAQSIVWLDDQVRTMQPLSARQESWMFDVLQSGGHPQWDKEYKFWFFNSAFNVLHFGVRHEELTRLLTHLAVHDPEKTMRLYALQHLEIQRTQGHVAGALADEVRAMLVQIAEAPDSQEAGLALRLLAGWDGAGSAVNPEVIAQALKLAAETSRCTDIRVTALQTAGLAALDLARSMANDPTQPMLVRKASIALIGTHGGESDLAHLKKLSAESSRLAQAADPALQTLRQRIASPHAPALIPF